MFGAKVGRAAEHNHSPDGSATTRAARVRFAVVVEPGRWQIGAALMAWGAGSIRDATGSYRPAWIIAGTGCLIAAAGTQRISAVRPRQPVTLASA